MNTSPKIKTDQVPSESSDQTPEFTVDSNMPGDFSSSKEGFRTNKDEGISKLSVSPFVSPHRKEVPKSNFLNFRTRVTPDKYTLTNDNHIPFEEKVSDFKRNFDPISDFKDSWNVFQTDSMKSQENYKFDKMESTPKLHFKESQNNYNRDQIYRKLKSSK